MIGLLMNAIITALIMGIIGWQARLGAFPFRNWRHGGPSGGWEWINTFFTVYNLYAVGSNWLALGMFTPPALVYGSFIVISFVIGWKWVEFNAFIQNGRAFGWKYALKDAKDRATRSIRNGRK